MAAVFTDEIEVGLYPLPATAPRYLKLLGLPAGDYEFKPIVEALPDAEPTYVKPYQSFSLTVEAIPTLPNEVITNFTVTGPSYCILEEPRPSFDTTRSFDTEFEIPASPLWVGPLYNEPFVFNSEFSTGASPIVTISGYFSERNFYDREWLLRLPDSIVKVSGNGVQYETLEVIKAQEELFDPSMLVKTYPSGISAENFYPLSFADAKLYDAAVMEEWIKRCSDIISYKPSDIMKLRVFFDITIVSSAGTFLSTAHMTVQNDQDTAIDRLEYAINTPKLPRPLFNVV